MASFSRKKSHRAASCAKARQRRGNKITNNVSVTVNTVPPGGTSHGLLLPVPTFQSPQAATSDATLQNGSIIQNNIARMANGSATIKGLYLPYIAIVMSVEFLVAFTNMDYPSGQWARLRYLFLIGIIFALVMIASSIVFSLLDAKYLRLERILRDLYDKVRTGNVQGLADISGHVKDAHKKHMHPLSSVVFTWSVAGLYFSLCLIAILAYFLTVCVVTGLF